MSPTFKLRGEERNGEILDEPGPHLGLFMVSQPLAVRATIACTDWFFQIVYLQICSHYSSCEVERAINSGNKTEQDLLHHGH